MSATSVTSTDEFYSATSHGHGSHSLSHEHNTSNGQTSSGHYITAPENPFVDPANPEPQSSSGNSHYSTASQASVSFHAHVVQHRGTSAAIPLRSRRTASSLRPTTGHSSSGGQSIISSDADPEAARCISPDEKELFYQRQRLNVHHERDERPSDDATVSEQEDEDRRYTGSVAKAKKVLGVDP